MPSCHLVCCVLLPLLAGCLGAAPPPPQRQLPPPRNPSLADGPWPACHGDSFATDTTTALGPSSTEGSAARKQLLTHDTLFSRANMWLPVSLVYDAPLVGHVGVLIVLSPWTTTTAALAAAAVAAAAVAGGGGGGARGARQRRLRVATRFTGRFDFSYHGAYSSSRDHVYFSSTRRGFRTYWATEPISRGGAPRRVDRFPRRVQPAHGVRDERVVGVLLLYPEHGRTATFQQRRRRRGGAPARAPALLAVEAIARRAMERTAACPFRSRRAAVGAVATAAAAALAVATAAVAAVAVAAVAVAASSRA